MSNECSKKLNETCPINLASKIRAVIRASAGKPNNRTWSRVLLPGKAFQAEISDFNNEISAYSSSP